MEALIKAALNDLVDGRVYPDVTPDNPPLPLIVYQQVGGIDYVYVDKESPNHENARVQVYVWADSRMEARRIARQARNNIMKKILKSEPVGAPTSLHHPELNRYGTRQDFSIWYKY